MGIFGRGQQSEQTTEQLTDEQALGAVTVDLGHLVAAERSATGEVLH